MQKSSNFDILFETDMFSCAFLQPAFFHISASTLRSKSRFECKVEASKQISLNNFSLHGNSEVFVYRSAYGGWLQRGSKLLRLVKTWFRSKGRGENKTILSGLLGTLSSPLQPETAFPSTLHTKTELGPGGQFPGLATSGPDCKDWARLRTLLLPLLLTKRVGTLFDAFANFFKFLPQPLQRQFFPLLAWHCAVQLPGILPRDVWASSAKQNELWPWRPTGENWGMRKNMLLLLAKILTWTNCFLGNPKSYHFDTCFNTNVFSCAFLQLAFFHMFASTLRSKSRFDCKVVVLKNFRLHRFFAPRNLNESDMWTPKHNEVDTLRTPKSTKSEIMRWYNLIDLKK